MNTYKKIFLNIPLGMLLCILSLVCIMFSLKVLATILTGIGLLILISIMIYKI